MTEPRLTAVVLTLNEAEQLPGCLRSLRPLTDDILVLDSGSTDRTRELAARAGARVACRPFDGYASQRNAALELVSQAAWVIFLDADERLTPAGAAEIRHALSHASDDLAALWLPRRNFAFGTLLRGGGWWPDHQARVLRRGRAYYDPQRQVHETVQIAGASRYLTQPLTHFNYATRREFVRKQRAYTILRVRARPADAACPRRRAYVSGPAREFWRRFVQLGGYRDGLTGLFLAATLAVEEARAVWLIRRRAPR